MRIMAHDCSVEREPATKGRADKTSLRQAETMKHIVEPQGMRIACQVRPDACAQARLTDHVDGKEPEPGRP
jgi:hypothetical protein